MKLATAFTILIDVYQACQLALYPTFAAIWASPLQFLRNPQLVSRTFMAFVWAGGFGDGTDQNAREVKEHLITPNAFGVVLDVGAGHGHTIRYLDRSRVTKYIALEPNILMHDKIREAAERANFYESDGSLVILSHGAEDSAAILSSLCPQSYSSAPSPPIDTIIAILVLCTLPSPQKTISNLTRDLLRQDGQFLFYEHVLSDLKEIAWWQRFWTPMWHRVFDGCRLDRPSHLWVEDLRSGSGSAEETNGDSVWKEGETWRKPLETEETLFCHRVGRYVKK